MIKTSKARKDRQILTPDEGGLPVELGFWLPQSHRNTLAKCWILCNRGKAVNHRDDQTRQPNFALPPLAIPRQEKIDIAYPPIAWGKLTCCAGAVINHSPTGTPRGVF